MKKNLFFAFMAVLFATVFASCSDDVDGKWEKMKWSTDVKTANDGYVEVPEDGGTYVFTCKNYPDFWLVYLYEAEGTNVQKTYTGDENSSDYMHINGTWATVKSEDSKLYVTIEPNTTENGRVFSLTVTAGDIFDYFNFRQSASSK